VARSNGIRCRSRNPSATEIDDHYPAVTDLAGVGAILRAARATDPSKGIQRAHVLLAFTGQRVSEVVGAGWSEIDLDAGTWTIPRDRMKRKDEERGPHQIPLPARPTRAVEGMAHC
jgi:integrase